MKKFYVIFVLLITISVFISGCSTAPKRIDAQGNEGLTTVDDINFKDWQSVASKTIDSILKDGVLDRVSARIKRDRKLQYNPQVILMVGTVKNKTTQHIDTEILTANIRQALRKSGKALTTTAVSGNGAEDNSTRDVRELQNDEMFNQQTVAKMGTAIAPDMSLAGQIIQQKTKQGRTTESYFMFHVTLTDLKTGLALWEDTFQIAKQGTKSFIGW